MVRPRFAFVLPLILLSLVQPALASMADLLAKEKTTVEGGTVYAGYFRGITRFPNVSDIKWGAGVAEIKEGKLSYGNGAGEFRPVKGDADALTMVNNGRWDKEKEGWVPMLVFEPSAAGTYSIEGIFRVGGPKRESKAMSWSVFRIDEKQTITPVALGRGLAGADVDLNKQAGYGQQRLDHLDVAANEKIGIALWWAPMYEAGGGQLHGFAIKPTAAIIPPKLQPVAKPAASDRDRRYPANVGIVDATQPPYNAKGDGVTDDTAAIQRAMSENNRSTVFLPNGTYLVSRQLSWQSTKGDRVSHLMLLGESREGTIIKLQDRCPMYTDSDENPMDTNALAVLRTESDSGPPDAAIENFIRNLTVDTGKGNAGAIGISFIGNNIAAVEDVTIRSGDGSGLVGLAMTRIPGPALVKNVRIEGFDYAANMREVLYNMVLENIEIVGQNKAGIVNPAGMLTIHNLTSRNAVPAVVNTASKHPNSTDETPLPLVPNAMTQVIDAKLEGGAKDQPAIINTARLYARNITTAGYRVALNDNNQDIPGSDIAEFTGDEVLKLWDDAPKRAMDLPIKSTPPTYHSNDFSQWVTCGDYPQLYHLRGKPVPPAATKPIEIDPKGPYDHTEAIQAALDSGKPIVYFPRGKYYISKPLRVPATVKWIAGLRSTLVLIDGDSDSFGDPTNPQPMFRIEGDTEVPLTIDFVIFGGGNGRSRGAAVGVLHASRRLLVIAHSLISSFRNAPDAGPLFVDNNCATDYIFDHPQEVFFKQFNPEGQQLRIVNNGGRVSILGLKTEGGNGVVKTIGGGQTEVIGAFLRPSAGYPMAAPAFESIDSQMSVIACGLTWGEARWGPRIDRDYHFYIRETRQGVTRTITRADLEQRKLVARTSVVVPLFVGFGPNPQYNPKPAAVEQPSSDVPKPWTLRDVGQPDSAGHATFYADGNLIEQSGMGRGWGGRYERYGIGDILDGCSFLELPAKGDLSISARIGAIRQTYGPRLKAGLMLRDAITSDAPAVFAGLRIAPGRDKKTAHQLVLLQRTKAGEAMKEIAAVDAVVPVNIRLERRGGQVIASTSADGKTWTPFGKTADTSADSTLIGTAVAGENWTHPATAHFEDLTIQDGQGKLLVGGKPNPLAPWITDDSAPREPGYSLLSEGSAEKLGDDSFKLTGSGWAFDSHQYIRFALQQVPKGKQIVAQVRWLEDPSKLPITAEAGVIIRESAGYRGVDRAMLAITPSELLLENRIDSKKVIRTPLTIKEPWLKLAFVDGAYLAYLSPDGKSWQLVGGTASKAMGEGMLMGLMVTSGDLIHQSSAQFDHVSISDAQVTPEDIQAVTAAK